MNFIRKRAILSLIAISLQAPIEDSFPNEDFKRFKDFEKKAREYPLKIESSTPILDLSLNSEYDHIQIPPVSGITMLLDKYKIKRTSFELITECYGRAYLRNMGLTEAHIDAIIDARERPTKEKLIALGLTEFEIEIFDW